MSVLGRWGRGGKGGGGASSVEEGHWGLGEIEGENSYPNVPTRFGVYLFLLFSQTTLVGLGQSLTVGIGGDPFPG